MAMDKTIRRVTDTEQEDAENFRYWQSLTLGERLGAVWEVTRDAYAIAGITISPESSPRKTLTRHESTWA